MSEIGQKVTPTVEGERKGKGRRAKGGGGREHKKGREEGEGERSAVFTLFGPETNFSVFQSFFPVKNLLPL